MGGDLSLWSGISADYIDLECLENWSLNCNLRHLSPLDRILFRNTVRSLLIAHFCVIQINSYFENSSELA